MKLKSISPSRIKTFDMCLFKYFLTYHTKEKLKSNWGAAHGSLLHDILEFKSNGTDDDWMKRLYDGYGGTLKTFDRYGNDTVMESPLRWAKPEDFHNKTPHCDSCCYNGVDKCIISQEPLDNLSGCARSLFDDSISMLETVIDDYSDVWNRILRDKNGDICGAEYRYTLPVKGTDVPMIGVMDLVVEESPDTIRIYDYKTGKWTQTYEECRDDIQIKMYSLAARKEFIEDINNKGHKYKNVLLTFDYFTKSPVTLAFTEEEDAETEKYVLSKIEEIQNTEWITRIVKDNSDFEKKWAWKCRSLCDPGVCKSKWAGAFKMEDSE